MQKYIPKEQYQQEQQQYDKINQYSPTIDGIKRFPNVTDRIKNSILGNIDNPRIINLKNRNFELNNIYNSYILKNT